MKLSKRDVKTMLAEKDLEGMIETADDKRKLVSHLIAISYNKTDVIGWRAIEAIGLATVELAKTDPEFVRNVVGRLLWMIRDESGGCGWSAPDSLGEIVRNNPVLCEDTAPVIASFHFEPPLRAPVMWAMSRIGKINDVTVDYTLPIIRSFLDNADKTVRAYAAWALASMGNTQDAALLEKLADDSEIVDFYESRELKKKKVSEIARHAFNKLKAEEVVLQV